MERRRYAFVMDPMDTVILDRDSSFVLMEEAQRRGAAIYHLEPRHLRVRGGDLRGTATRIRVGRPHVYEAETGPEEVDLGAMDAVFMRKDPPFDMEYIFATMLLDLVRERTVVVNDPVGIRNANEKIATLRFPEICPATLLDRDVGNLREFAANAPGAVVVKPWDGNGGRGVFVAMKGDRNLGSILETLTGEGRRHVLVQHYVPEIRQGDKRIVLVDGEPMGAFLRVPGEHDHRGNMHVGARVVPCDIGARDLEICGRIAPFLREQGLLFAGIDVIGGLLTEINVTSPTGLQEIRRFHGIRIEEAILDRVEAMRKP